MKIKILGVYSEDAVKGMKDSSYAARVQQIEAMGSQIDSKLIDCDFLGGDLDVCATMEVPDWSTALGLKQAVQMSGVFEEIMFYPVVDLDTIIGTMNKFSGVYKAPGKES
jgi:uncharacterized protein with GYD domain